MGASEFMTKSHGNTAQEAFGYAVQNAAWNHGHGGYTGTIAEKKAEKKAAKKNKIKASK